MAEHMRFDSNWTWIPMDKRLDRFGLPLPPRRPELRKPMFWVIRDRQELYFINNSGQTLDSVSSTTSGFHMDDTGATRLPKTRYTYPLVQANEAIMIESFDIFIDSDSMLQIKLYIESSPGQSLRITLPAAVGGGRYAELVLLWDSGEPGDGVAIDGSHST
jgi:hypothetical protein